MTDRIEKTVELKAPVARVWRALTDYQEFGQWFRVRLDGPFVAGQVARGNITHPGYEHLRWEAVVQRMEPERLFSFTWHPYAIDPNQDYSGEPPTLVEFTLEKIATGTRLRIVENLHRQVLTPAQVLRLHAGRRGRTARSLRTPTLPETEPSA